MNEATNDDALFNSNSKIEFFFFIINYFNINDFISSPGNGKKIFKENQLTTFVDF